MEKVQLTQKIDEYIREWNEQDVDGNIPLLKLESLMLEYLKSHPRDTGIWFKLALAQQTIPLADWPGAVASLNKILEYDPLNIKALLLKAYIYYMWGATDEATDNALAAVNTCDVRERALIYYVRSWYFSRTDRKTLKEEMIKKSISVCPDFVRPHLDLAKIYEKRNQLKEACFHYNAALNNIKFIFKEVDFIDILDFDDLFYKQIMQLQVIDFNIEELVERRDRCCAKIANK